MISTVAQTKFQHKNISLCHKGLAFHGDLSSSNSLPFGLENKTFCLITLLNLTLFHKSTPC